MIDPHSLAEYSSQVLNASGNAELEQRLGLYRVFLKLYEHHRSLLDEILDLENTGTKLRKYNALQYIQGVVQEHQVHIVTNLLSDKTRSVLQPQNIWVIGRDRKMALSIPDKRLSRRHAAIQHIEDEGFYLVDFKSTNGTFVNGEPVQHCVLLQDGDQLRLGSLAFTFFICHAPKTAEALPDDVFQQVNAARHARHSGTEDATVTEGTVTEGGLTNPPADWEAPLSSSETKETSIFLRSSALHDGVPVEQASYSISTTQKGDILDRFMHRHTPDNRN